MFLRRGRDRQAIEDDLLTRADVARQIERDQAQVARWESRGQMPPADVMTASGRPMWTRSTIRSWWLGRGHGLAGQEVERLRTPAPQAQPPQVLADELIDSGVSGPVHVRVYHGVDGRGPVVLLGRLTDGRPLGGTSAHWATLADEVRSGLSSTAAVDLDWGPTPLWLTVEDDSPDDSPPQALIYQVDPDAVDADRYGPRLQPVGPTQLRQLIGVPVEIYPRRHYREETIRARQAAPLGPAQIIDDLCGIAPLAASMREAIRRAQPGSPDAQRWRAVAGLMADRVLFLDADIRDSQEAQWRGPWDDDDPDPDPDVVEAVVIQPLQLVEEQRRLAEAYRVDTATLYTRTRVRGTARDQRDRWLADHDAAFEWSPELLATTDWVRTLLRDPDLADDDPARQALGAANELITALMHRDLRTRVLDQPTTIRTHTAAVPLIRDYLEQASILIRASTGTHMAHQIEHDLDRRLVRRARDLLASHTRYSPSGETRDLVLRFHDHLGLLSMTGVSGSEAYSPDSVEPSPEARLEWPQAMSEQPGAMTGPDIHLVAPRAGDEVYRPVFFRDALGGLSPLPSQGPLGPAWGVSSTDQLTPVVLAYLRGPGGEGADYRLSADESNRRAEVRRRLSRLLTARGAQELDVPTEDIWAWVREYSPRRSEG